MSRHNNVLTLAAAVAVGCAQALAGATKPAGRAVTPARHLQLDLAKRRIVVTAAVSERHEAMEFLLCKRGTKDYESLMVTDVQPSALHTALLALNLMPGRPGRWSNPPGKEPVFLSPAGPMLDISLRWTDAKGVKHEAPATDWMLIVTRKKKAEPTRWVFVGSSILDDGSYWADVEGHHVSVANFASSVIDVPFKSSDKTAFLEFGPNTAAIPPKGTPVEVVITPVKGAEKAPVARVTFTVDALGRIEMDGRPIAPEDIEQAVKDFLSRHPKGLAEVLIDPRAMVFDRDRLATILENAGMTEVSFRMRVLTAEVLPRSAEQAGKAIAWWKKQFAEAAEALVDPGKDAARTLEHIERRVKQVQAFSALWGDYAARLRALLAKHRAARKGEDKPGGQGAP